MRAEIKMKCQLARDLPEAWWLCIRELMSKYDNGDFIYPHYRIDSGSYAGSIRRHFGFVVVHIIYPGSRPLIPDIPPGLGIPAPTSDEYVEGYFSRYLMSNVREPGETYTYGERLVGRVGTDDKNQIEEAIRIYKEDGHGTNQVTLEVGMPSDIGTVDPPCLRFIDTRVSNGKLHFFPYFRSWDLWGGFPSNLAGLQMMKEYMAAEIGVEDGEMVVASKGLHLYDYSWDLARIRAFGAPKVVRREGTETQ